MKTLQFEKESLQQDFEKTSALLWELKEEHGASGLKLSTEDAGMSFQQISYWSQIASPVFPVIVKIGGPEARNDMKMLSNLNDIAAVVAPMIESPYSLRKYISSLKEIFGDNKFKGVSKHINIETITAFENLSHILSVPEAGFIEEITIGRGDLSRSINKEADDQEVSRISKIIIEEAQRKNIKVSIGGTVNPKNAKQVFEEMKPDKINTRSIVFNRGSSSDVGKAVLMALEFEIIMMKEDLKHGFVSIDEARDRTEKLKKRMAVI